MHFLKMVFVILSFIFSAFAEAQIGAPYELKLTPLVKDEIGIRRTYFCTVENQVVTGRGPCRGADFCEGIAETSLYFLELACANSKGIEVGRVWAGELHKYMKDSTIEVSSKIEGAFSDEFVLFSGFEGISLARLIKRPADTRYSCFKSGEVRQVIAETKVDRSVGVLICLRKIE